MRAGLQGGAGGGDFSFCTKLFKEELGEFCSSQINESKI